MGCYRQTGALHWAIKNGRLACLVQLVLAGATFTQHELRQVSSQRSLAAAGINQWLLGMVVNARSLQDLCRLGIRRQLKLHRRNQGILPLISGLALPSRMRDYLSYNTREVAEILQLHEVQCDHDNIDEAGD